MEVLHDLRARRRVVSAARATEPASRSRGRIAACVALLPALLACADARRGDATADTAVMHSAAMDSVRRAGGGGVPDTVSSDTLPADTATFSVVEFVSRADSAAGDSLYRRGALCLTCHGPRGEGVANLGPDLRDAVWHTGDGSPAAIERIVLEGVSQPKVMRIQMPTFGARLATGDARRIAVYVYTLSHPGAALADSLSPIPADSAPAARVP